MDNKKKKNIFENKLIFGPKGIVASIRFLIFLVVFFFLLYGQKTTFFTYRYIIPISIFYLLTNLIFFVLPDRLFTQSLIIIFLLDLSFISLGIYLTQGFETELYLIYFLVIFMSGLTQNIKLNLLTSFVAGMLYLGISLKIQGTQDLLTPGFLLRFPFIFITGLFTSFYSSEILRWKQETKQKSIELGTALETARQKEEQLIKQEKKLSELALMASGIAHEINNPLTTILGYSQLILQEMGEEKEHEQEIREMINAALRCKKIIQGLLRFSHQEEPKFATVNINEIVENSIVEVANEFNLAGVQIIKNLSTNLGDILADGEQLKQVFVNIMDNAKDSMSQGNTLTVSTEKENSKIKIKFTDTGVGIPKEMIDRIFDPFFTTKETGKGTGLALSESYGIVKKHDGKIEVESEVGKGSTFTVIISQEHNSVK
jgi:signal transduction histidine kinase